MLAYSYNNSNQILLTMNEALKPIKGRKSKPMKELKEIIYSKLYDSIDYLLDNECYLPKLITVSNEKVDLQLNENERKKLKNIIWYISHSKLWSES